MKPKVLFVCIHNSARSQMAEMLLKKHCGHFFDVSSAGIEPGKINPLAVEALKEIGIDISLNKTKSVFELFKTGEIYRYVITVCDEASAERCPIFPGITKRLHWSFPDPSALQGSHEDKLAETRKIRDTIEARIKEWCKEVCM